jgi:hypothetical protein
MFAPPSRLRPANRLKSPLSSSTVRAPGQVLVEIKAIGVCHT